MAGQALLACGVVEADGAHLPPGGGLSCGRGRVGPWLLAHSSLDRGCNKMCTNHGPGGIDLQWRERVQ
jgi:hypothetical protein